MSIKYGFFNSVDGDRLYNAEDLGRYLHGLISSGVYADSSDSLQVLANGDMTVTVQPGRAMLDCHYMENDAPLTLTLASGSATERIDAVVMRLDLRERTCSIYVKQGPLVLPPIAPKLTRDDAVQEWRLASIRVPKLATSITQSAITDTRPDNTVCGWVTSLIDQVDTSALFAQWQAAYEEQYELAEANRQAQEAAFNEWLATLVEDAVVNDLPVPTPNNAGNLVMVNYNGTKYTLGIMPFPYLEDEQSPGSFCRRVDLETEWVNPPMDPGVEYRTAERYDGLPVYVKRVQFNELDHADLFASNTMFIDVAEGMEHPISVTGKYTVGGPTGTGNFDHLLPCSTVEIVHNYMATGTPLTVTVNSAQTLRALELVVKYTKA